MESPHIPPDSPGPASGREPGEAQTGGGRMPVPLMRRLFTVDDD